MRGVSALGLRLRVSSKFLLRKPRDIHHRSMRGIFSFLKKKDDYFPASPIRIISLQNSKARSLDFRLLSQNNNNKKTNKLHLCVMALKLHPGWDNITTFIFRSLPVWPCLLECVRVSKMFPLKLMKPPSACHCPLRVPRLEGRGNRPGYITPRMNPITPRSYQTASDALI